MGETVKIKNKKNTSGDEAPDGSSWKDYWKKEKNIEWPKECCVKDCHKDAKVGAHVYKIEDKNKTYIVPMCKDCNNASNDKEMKVDEKYLLEI